MQTRAIIVAAGVGKRMNSKKPKVLHEVCGIPMITRVINAVKAAGISELHVVTGSGHDEVTEILPADVNVAVQEKQEGTAHAVSQTSEELSEADGNTLIIFGDTPLISPETIKNLVADHEHSGLKATVLSAYADNPKNFGRVIRKENGTVKAILEQTEVTHEQEEIKEVSAGAAVFNNRELFKVLKKITNDNPEQEYYLSDAVGLLSSKGSRVGAFVTPDNDEIINVDNRILLARASELLRQRINEQHLEQGVTIIDPSNTYIDESVRIGMDTIIYPNTVIKGDTVIGENAIISANCEISNSVIGDNAEIKHSVVTDAEVGSSTTVGPYAQLRPGAKLGEAVKIGNFVEVKKSELKDGAKVSHLSYIGDAEIGERANIGCGAITVNYDGVNKFKTTVGADAFIGCNTNLVAPVTVGSRSITAAGSTITDDVPDDSLAIARNKQTTKEGYYKK
ncbi:bifunctional protein GlmU [Jeotgalicoccus coquinae]|uniref:Bifunctional protein GlmU n=1 Tax=Jeotgalicoccus coquinae TaxID=709509 RepID=A0A6V7RQB1_9STAP|nr:bifunctional UDP-N-acetylglucosamine diphosphorylase/glucosamine-1-phosphate N-acetyltransferase GlmU [Jeotgalicoccus coquinae]MBB6423825.1 bifunctional UDP-N-acetylglucosamine pyrophosphorylase/glucosamine-1-phosphate N-acetyltransferase [Jeotgalicoccus coquinae]GGE24677.1 bifunctional protein GlmU [Jeotgalicoccus coquinae]CAD2080837.1 Bifunctional protein GlmU [Jeotgalicoccus coquinae]